MNFDGPAIRATYSDTIADGYWAPHLRRGIASDLPPPCRRFQNALPQLWVTSQGVSVLTIWGGQSSFDGVQFLRIGKTAVGFWPMMAVSRQRRGSEEAP